MTADCILEMVTFKYGQWKPWLPLAADVSHKESRRLPRQLIQQVAILIPDNR